MCEVYPSVEVLFYTAKQIAIKELNLESGDKIIITGGTSNTSGKTNTIRIETI
jgi:pyruvate kinase